MTNHYTYKITWSEEDREFVALCLEFPSLSYLAKTQDVALKGMIKLVDDIISDMQKNNEPIPEPLAEKHFSGKLMIRIPPERHRLLAMKAAEAKISLNRFISDKLSDD